ncbi:oxidoreductase [Salinibacterium xinjiangense]|uniref:Predicted dehydrogenase n=1 Tax=Salinibacterium xinjiangense TaxID=386302 RepID=A0A2C8ZMK4_9MICO|nr:Gfo/Idh/MocA family oxidoreductase [Salinibacterium xinjiangense]GGK86784.1 oxidoreductase [Salinibacterium xinjiangense]SOE66270.1 Predicted dehydrogenase [Salinibacterium xinjiangense]
MPTTHNPNPIRTGIIGFGLSGRVFHAPFIATNPAFRLDLISTGSPDRAAQATAQHPGAEIVGSPDELLARAADLDLVILASPAHVHLEQALAAFEAGANVVIDKPFVPTVTDAKQLIAAAEDAGKLLAVFQNRRWDGDFLTIRRLLVEGALGDIHRFESTFERWGGALRDRWQDSTTPEQGAGITYDLGSHLIDQALQLFGPATVDAAELTVVRDGGVSDDDAFISLLHDSGVRSHLTMSRAAGQTGPRFRVLGSESSYSVNGLDNQEPFLKEQRWPGSDGYGVTPEAEWGLIGVADDLEPTPTERGAYPDFYAGVAASILEGAPSPVDPKEALEVVRIIERAHALSAAASV